MNTQENRMMMTTFGVMPMPRATRTTGTRGAIGKASITAVIGLSIRSMTFQRAMASPSGTEMTTEMT